MEQMKYIKIYLLKRKKLLQKIYYVHKKSLSLVCEVVWSLNLLISLQ
jgi:hypothetical protein